MHIEGNEVQGRTLFVTGVSGALQAFKEVQASKEPKPIIQAEQVLLTQELKFCDKNNKILISSLRNR